MSGWYLLNHQTFCFQSWYCDASLWVEFPAKRLIAVSRSVALQELILSKYDNFYCIFWTADPFATKLSLIVHYLNAECLMEKLIVVFKVKVTAKFQNVIECLSTWYFLSFLSHWTFLPPNLVWWCIIISQIVFQKDWFAVFKIKVS